MDVQGAIPLVLLLGSCIAGCDSRRGDATTEEPAPAAQQPAATPIAADPQEDIDAASRYACDGDTSVAILRDGNAQVSMPDGSKVELARIGGSKPAVFTGSSLYLTIGEHGAHLSQQDETNELACRLL